ncbi:MAG: hypothetical protein GY795_36755 [Desulfobacterales bacterium]|nr:hypothetical protein [Desulfobacterales bacterium]
MRKTMGLRTKIITVISVAVLIVAIFNVLYVTFYIGSEFDNYEWKGSISETIDKDQMGDITDKIKNDIKKTVVDKLWFMVSITSGILVVILVIMFFMIGKFVSSVNRLIEMLKESSWKITSASGQVTSDSLELAQDLSQQASSIEETSSSLEEISSMTKKNADNANQADHLVNDSKQIVGTANESVVELTVSMEDISKASEETSKIIKTIDEIAFQTNLLALNAAVEAARAGEAGSGFAVVADEVRNLAMRAAEAARNTSELIEGTVKRVKDGAELVTKTNENFTGVASSTMKIGELIAEIASTSNEQARDIEQVNRAVAEMDKITRQNASNAEKSASSSEQMNDQVEQMKGFVEEMIGLFGGGTGMQKAYSRSDYKKSYAAPSKTWDLKKPQAYAPVKAENRNMAPYREKEVRPEQIIPMDDDDFEDF